MKNTLSTLLAILFAGSLCSAQVKYPSSILKDENGTFTYEKVVEVPNVNKDVLYKRVKEWVMVNVKTADNNIVFDDSGFDKIITSPTLAMTDVRFLKNQKTNFKLVINFKDSKFRIAASSFIYYGEAQDGRDFNVALEELKVPRVLPNPAPKAMESFDKAFGNFIAALEKAGKDEGSGNW